MLDLLSSYGLLGCKRVITPMEQNLKFDYCVTDYDSILKQLVEYQKLVGILKFLILKLSFVS